MLQEDYFTKGTMNTYRLLFLSQEDIISLDLRYEDVIDGVERVMSAHAKGLCQLPSKIHVNPLDGTYLNAMPAYIGGDDNLCGLKWVSGYPSNREKGLPVTWGIMILNDYSTGAPLAIMDARWITAIRTAAVAAVTAKYCAKREVNAMTIIGAGEQGKWNARLMKIVKPGLKKIFVDDLYPQAREAYLAKMQPLLPDVEFIPIHDEKERLAAIDESDILLTATQRGSKPIIYWDMLHRGMLGLPLESTAWEGKTYTSADRFVCDDKGLVETYNHDGKYTDGLPDTIFTIGEIVNGDAPGRLNDDEFVIASSHGVAISDVMLAQMIYDNAKEDGLGVELPLLREGDIIR